MLDMRKYAGSTFIGVDNLRDGAREETIVSVTLGKYDKPVALFESGDQFTLNKTNTGTLIKSYGPNGQDWVGCTIELSIGLQKYNGDDIESVVVKPVTPPKPTEARTPVPKPPASNNDMKDDIPF